MRKFVRFLLLLVLLRLRLRFHLHQLETKCKRPTSRLPVLVCRVLHPLAKAGGCTVPAIPWGRCLGKPAIANCCSSVCGGRRLFLWKGSGRLWARPEDEGRGRGRGRVGVLGRSLLFGGRLARCAGLSGGRVGGGGRGFVRGVRGGGGCVGLRCCCCCCCCCCCWSCWGSSRSSRLVSCWSVFVLCVVLGLWMVCIFPS